MSRWKVTVWFCIVAGLAPALSGAQSPSGVPKRCPWLNEATASGVLNGPVTRALEQPSIHETVCLFRYENRKTVYSLRIEVSVGQDTNAGLKIEQSDCTGTAIPVRAIGNQAMQCDVDRRTSHGNALIGRVRNAVFRVGISTSLRNDPAMPRDVLEQKARDIGEAVAGSLF